MIVEHGRISHKGDADGADRATIGLNNVSSRDVDRPSERSARGKDVTNALEETKILRGTGRWDGDADISLRHLFVFKTVAREGSAAGAAGKLLRANSAIVRSVGVLEQQLGERLFDRHPRGMLINAFGQAVLTRADRIAAELTELSSVFDEGRSPRPGAPRGPSLPPCQTAVASRSSWPWLSGAIWPRSLESSVLRKPPSAQRSKTWRTGWKSSSSIVRHAALWRQSSAKTSCSGFADVWRSYAISLGS